MSVRFTVIGCAGTHASAERVCSSYLLRHEGTTLLLDLGSGALHNLQKVIAIDELDAVVVSHLHPDHFIDLLALNYALRFHPAEPGPVPVHGPAALEPTLSRLLPEESVEKMRDLLHFRSVSHGDILSIGSLELSFAAMNHPADALGARISAGDVVIAYTGDTAPTPNISTIAQDADLLVIDSTWMESQRPLPPDIHCTGLEAGQAAAAAGARRMVVTHVSPYNDAHAVAAEAARAYDGEIIVAVDLQEITL